VRLAVPREVGGRRKRRHRQRTADRYRHHVIGQALAQPEPGIEATRHEVLEAVIAVQFDDHVRIGGHEFAEVGHDHEVRHHAGQIDAQDTSRRLPRFVHGVHGPGDGGQAGLGLGQETATDFGDTHPTRGPVEKAHTQPRLQRANRL
jgi:hypothetical protein